MGSTRAGLLVAGLRGMFAAAEAETEIGAPQIERPFSIKAEDFTALMVEWLNQAIAASDEHNEAFDDVRFDLVTDKQAEGAFLGRKIKKTKTRVSAALKRGLDAVKNEAGAWEATITFES